MLIFAIIQQLVVGLLTPSPDRINDLMRDPDKWGDNEMICLSYGPLAIPTYREMLINKNSPPSSLYRILQILLSNPSKPPHNCGFPLDSTSWSFLLKSRGDVRSLIDQILPLLSHKNNNIRIMSAEFIGRYGSAKDAAPVCVLLFDDDFQVVYEAAKTLSIIGDKNSLLAIELWRRSPSNNARKDVLKASIELEQKLRTRLEKAEAERKK